DAAGARGAQRHDVPAAALQPRTGTTGSPRWARAAAGEARHRRAGRPTAGADTGAPAALAERGARDRARAAEPDGHLGVGMRVALHDQRRDGTAPADLVDLRRGCLGRHGAAPARGAVVARRILVA